MPGNTAKLGIADTFTRLLRLTLAGGAELTLTQLMDASEERLGAAARSGSRHEQLIASRLRDNPRDYRRWELEHSAHMERVLKAPRRSQQAIALLSLGFALTHRRALFEFLRTTNLRGWRRRQLVKHFHGGHSYSQAMVAEHGTYLRSAASLICVEHLGTSTLPHPAFGDPFLKYQHSYVEYFRTYCHSAMTPESAPETDTEQALLPALKFDLLEMRSKLLAMTTEPAARTPTAKSRASSRPKSPAPASPANGASGASGASGAKR